MFPELKWSKMRWRPGSAPDPAGLPRPLAGLRGGVGRMKEGEGNEGRRRKGKEGRKEGRGKEEEGRALSFRS